MKNKIIYITLIILCLIALIGFIFPAVIIDIDLLGNSRSISLSLESLINKPENPFGGANLDTSSSIASRFADMDLFDFSGSSFEEIRNKITTSVGMYFISFILLIVLLIFAIIDKLKKTRIFLSAASFALFVYAGYNILTIPEPLTNTVISNIENVLGFFAMFINIADLLTLNIALGNGYWIIISTLGCLFLFTIISLIIKNKASE